MTLEEEREAELEDELLAIETFKNDVHVALKKLGNDTCIGDFDLVGCKEDDNLANLEEGFIIDIAYVYELRLRTELRKIEAQRENAHEDSERLRSMDNSGVDFN